MNNETTEFCKRLWNNAKERGDAETCADATIEFARQNGYNFQLWGDGELEVAANKASRRSATISAAFEALSAAYSAQTKGGI